MHRRRLHKSPPLTDLGEISQMLSIAELVEDITDIYKVGDSPSERWRTFINCTAWHPKHFHDQIFKSRAYHARIFWEACQMIAITEADWLATTMVFQMRDIAHMKMRACEIEIFSFHLTLGMTGIGAPHRATLFDAALLLWQASCLVAKIVIAQGAATPTQQKALKQIMALRPKPGLSMKEFGRKIDLELFGLKELCSKGLLECKLSDQEAFEIAQSLKATVFALDRVIVVVK